MIPWVILAIVAVPLLVLAFVGVSRSRKAGEHPAGEDAADVERNEREFADAEAYEEEWREEERKRPHDPNFL